VEYSVLIFFIKDLKCFSSLRNTNSSTGYFRCILHSVLYDATFNRSVWKLHIFTLRCVFVDLSRIFWRVRDIRVNKSNFQSAFARVISLIYSLLKRLFCFGWRTISQILLRRLVYFWEIVVLRQAGFLACKRTIHMHFFNKINSDIDNKNKINSKL